jgi:type II secretory pathway component PulM
MKRLSPREKRLVGAAGAAVAAFILIRFAVGPLLAYHSRLREEIPAMRRGLIAARRCAARFAALRNEVGAVQARLADRKKEFNPYTSLSEMARREGLSTEEIVMEKKPLDENFQEETAKVTLRRVPLDKLVGYLYNIETSPDLMTVKVLSVAADSGDALLLDASLDASTITPAEKRETPAEKKAPAKKPRARKR